MANSVRKEILLSLKSILEEIDSIKTVEIRDSSILDLDVVPMPAIFIYSGIANKVEDTRAVISYENWNWNITLAIWARNTDMEDLFQEVQIKLSDNPTVGGNAANGEIQSIDMLIVDPDESLKVMMLDFEVLYRNPIGIP